MTEEDLGSFRKVDPAVVEQDPFWSRVRRRHPDVDVVLLPPGGADESAPPSATVPPDVLRSVTADLVRTWGVVADLLAERGVSEPPSVRWLPRGGAHALVVQEAVRGLGEDGGADLLRAVARLLGADGWRLRPASRDQRPLLGATNGLLDLQAEAGAGATVIRLATGLVPVAEADRDVVRDEVRQQVAAWA